MTHLCIVTLYYAQINWNEYKWVGDSWKRVNESFIRLLCEREENSPDNYDSKALNQ